MPFPEVRNVVRSHAVITIGVIRICSSIRTSIGWKQWFVCVSPYGYSLVVVKREINYYFSSSPAHSYLISLACSSCLRVDDSEAHFCIARCSVAVVIDQSRPCVGHKIISAGGTVWAISVRAFFRLPVAGGEAAFVAAEYAAVAFWAADSCGCSARVVVFPGGADWVASDVVGFDVSECLVDACHASAD